MPNDISSQGTQAYQWAVQTYGAQAADKAAEESGLAGADQAGQVGSGHLSVDAKSVDQLAAFYADLGTFDRSTGPSDVSSQQSGQLESLMEQSISGDTATFLARSMIKLYAEQRHENVLDRMQDGLAAQADLMGQADKLDKEADEMKTAAVVSLVTTVVSAAVSIGTAGIGGLGKMKALGQEMKAMRAETEAAQNLNALKSLKGEIGREEKLTGEVDHGLNADIARVESDLKGQMANAAIAKKAADRSATGFGMVQQMGEGTSRLIAAAGDYYSKSVDADVKHLEADSKRLEAEAQYYQTQGDMAKAKVEALNDMINQILGFVKDQQEAKAERFRTFSRV